jgi:hypothetical protein
MFYSPLMVNPYYYLFYLIARFFKRINKVDKDALDSSSTFISMCVLFNVVAIWFLLDHYKNIKVTTTGGIIASITVFFINHFVLTKDNKGEKLFDVYNEKFSASKNKSLIIMTAAIYIVFSLGSTIFLGVIFGKKFHH